MRDDCAARAPSNFGSETGSDTSSMSSSATEDSEQSPGALHHWQPPSDSDISAEPTRDDDSAGSSGSDSREGVAWSDPMSLGHVVAEPSGVARAGGLECIPVQVLPGHEAQRLHAVRG